MKPTLLNALLGSVSRATPEQEREFFRTHPYYGELKDNTVYINENRLRREGSRGNFVQDMYLGEALHNLKNVLPNEYNALYEAAQNDPAVQSWKKRSYDFAKKSGEAQGRSIDDWWNESRFDQVVGGYLFGGPNANVNTMRNWDRDRLPFGREFRNALNSFEQSLGLLNQDYTGTERMLRERGIPTQRGPSLINYGLLSRIRDINERN